MSGVILTGHGGFDRLEYRTDLPVPQPGPGEVLIAVGAAGINNTDINTRIGWYSKSVTGDTAEGGTAGYADDGVDDDGGWSGEPIRFPRIQGADCSGVIVDIGSDVDDGRMGERVLVRPMQEPWAADDSIGLVTFGSEMDGAFAEYAVARSSETFAVESSWSDVELASIPCAYSTAENLLDRVGLGAERVLVTGASGGVGSAVVQLATRRGAEVVAIAGASKAEDVRALGAHHVIDRHADPVIELGRDSIDVVVDLVAGDRWGSLLEVLTRGGRYATAGAIAGPIVSLDVRTLYLKDLTLLGATRQPKRVFEDLISYIEAGEIAPLVAATFPLAGIVEAQKVFLEKSFVGKLVLVP